MDERLDGTLDEAYERLHATGPEFRGWLSNHGPMAADALLRLGRGADVAGWVEGYSRRLEPAPDPRWAIDEAGWRDPLGDPSRLGDWLAFFARLVHEEPWQGVLTRWWPRLLPGAAASATHGLIRTGHAVRALLEHETQPRRDELGQALAYWAARWQPVPGEVQPRGDQSVGAALDGLPYLLMDEDWGARARLARLGEEPGWSSSLAAAAAPVDVDAVPAAIDRLTDVTVARYLRTAHAEPIMLVHASTAPRAAGLVLPALPVDQWAATYDAAWSVAAAITAAYRPASDEPPGRRLLESASESDLSTEALAEAAVSTRDEHAIKFAEVAVESHSRGNADALPAGLVAAALLSPGE